MKENVFVKDKLKKMAIAQYLQKKIRQSGFIDVEVIKSPISTRVVIYALRPGFVIGKSGYNIKALTEDLEKDFGLNKVHIEIGEIQNRDLDPKVIIENLANDISRGVAWKSAVYRAMTGMKAAGAVGAEIVAKGNTAGKGQRKRSSRYAFGYLKKAGSQKDLVAFEKRTTFPGLGTIGIRLRIVHPGTVFSDKIDVKELSHRFKLAREQKRLEIREDEVEKTLKDTKEKVEEKKKATEKKAETKIKAEKSAEEKPVEKKPRVKKVAEKKETEEEIKE
ncbi:MAG: 30S ribosomal protein S3 [archaeon]|jgi:small subunit ribosomal protein S3